VPKRIPATKQARRTAVARRIIEQKPVAAIAAELGISRVSVYNELQNPETQDYIQKLLAPRDAKLEALVDKSLAAIDEGLAAKRDDEADHGARMRCVERATKLLELRAGKRDDGDTGKQYRWSGELVDLMEMLVVYARVPTSE
jgi:hypothetical protein